MSGLSINFAEVEGSYTPLPEGNYDCVVERVEVRESKSSDNPYLNWELKVLDEEYEDRRLWMITSLSPKALFRLKDVFVALDVIDGDEELNIEWDDSVDVTTSGGPDIIDPELAGLPCVAVVTNEIWDGKERNRVNDLLGPDSGASPARASKSDDDDGAEKPKRKRQARKPSRRKVR